MTDAEFRAFVARAQLALTSRRAARIWMRLVGFVIVGALFWIGGINDQIIGTQQRTPRPDAGLVVPYDTKGGPYYITVAERQKITTLWCVFGGAIGVAAVSYWIWRERLREGADGKG